MANTKDLQDSIFPLKILVYGMFGVGKTLFGATFPKPRIIDTERGVKTLRGLDINYETFLENPDDKGKAYREIVEYANTCIKEMQPDETLIIDSLTMVNEYADNLAVKSSGGDKFKRWDYTLTWTKDFVDKLIAAPFNVIMTCQMKRILDDDGNIVSIVPAMAGSASDKVPYKFDEMYYLYTDVAGNRMIATDRAAKFDARSRLNREGIFPKVLKWNWDEKNLTNPVLDAALSHEKKLKGK